MGPNQVVVVGPNQLDKTIEPELVAARAEIARLEAENERASHPREHGRRRFITDPAHMPASHRAHLEWTPSRLVDWAAR